MKQRKRKFKDNQRRREKRPPKGQTLKNILIQLIAKKYKEEGGTNRRMKCWQKFLYVINFNNERIKRFNDVKVIHYDEKETENDA